MSDPLNLGQFLRSPELQFEQTSRFYVLGAADGSSPQIPAPRPVAAHVAKAEKAAPAVVAPPMVPVDSSTASHPIEAQIIEVGNEIRSLKAAKAVKEVIMAKVAELNALKVSFEEATGAAYIPPAGSSAPRNSGNSSKGSSKSSKTSGNKADSGPSGGAAPAAASAQAAPAAAASYDPAHFASIRSIGEECVTEADLQALLTQKPTSFRLYDGFEPSGRMHIAQGVFKAVNVNKCTAAGGTFVFWVADWFALMNDKMGGDLAKIKDVGRYFVEVWKAAGMDMSKVEFRWASEDITKQAATYWPQMLDIARRFTLARVTKCCTIMGRAEGNLTAAQILYPIMQCTDVFFLRADICQLGVDQRKVNMLAREYCDASSRKGTKPVILSHHMLYGLKQGQAKMSKSDPDSAIFMEDSRDDIARKLTLAFCPTSSSSANGGAAAVADGELRLAVDDLENPCLDYVKHIVLADRQGATFTAGGQTYASYEAVKEALTSGKLSESALKEGLIDEVDKLVAPVRQHFENDQEAKALLSRIEGYKKEDAAAVAKEALTKPLRCGNLLGGDGGAKEAPPVHWVVAPLPGPAVPLSLVFGLLARVRTAPKGSKVVVWCPDWSALVMSCLGGDAKVIRAAYTLLCTSCGALDQLAPPSSSDQPSWSQVQVLFQSDAILKDPSDYWISVINAGRALKLNEVKPGDVPYPSAATPAAGAAGEAAAVEESGGSAEAISEPAGCVVAALMHVGDMLGVKPSSVAASSSDVGPHNLALNYWASANVPTRNGFAPPVLVVDDSASSSSFTPSTWLASSNAPPGFAFSTVPATDDDYLVGDEPKAGANKKMKRAFCEPGNASNNPPLAIAKQLLNLLGTVEVENGKTYSGASAVNDMASDFSADVLTPQLLKPALTKAVATVLDAINAGIKASPDAKKAEATLKAANSPKKGGGGGQGKKQANKK